MVVTRFAPSPTGFLHIGGLRTAIFSYAFAKSKRGRCLLRIEDTDHLRSTKEATTQILKDLSWAGIKFDDEPILQSQRVEIHKRAVDKLLDEGKAYRCYCSEDELQVMRDEAKKKGLKPKYNMKCRPEEGKKLPPVPKGVDPVVRLKTPLESRVSWDDQIRGTISVENKELDDLILLRSDGSPTYQLSVVIDDIEMGITHVIRGDDHINNTPRQIHIFRAFGVEPPVFAHLPMIFNNDGKKMSKRHDKVKLSDYRDMGIEPQALLNYLCRLGWAKGDEEIFSMDDFVKWFDLRDVCSSPARFDMDKLMWMNTSYLRGLSNFELMERLSFSHPKGDQIMDLLRPRISGSLKSIKDHLSYFDPWWGASEAIINFRDEVVIASGKAHVGGV